jgi:hypothetical protein
MAILNRQTKEQKEIERLKSKHPVYDSYAKEWKVYLDLYEGGPQVLTTDYLFSHSRENEEDYVDRVKRASYRNYCKPLVQFFTDFIFMETIQRSGGNQDTFYQDFKKDVDKKGSPVDKFMSEISDEMQIYGMVYVAVDAPIVISPDLTVQQEKDFGVRPYWIKIFPDEILDWVVDSFGNYKYVKRFHVVTDVVLGTRVEYDEYTEYFQDSIIITQVDNTNKDKPIILSKNQSSNPFGIVPVVPIVYESSKRDSEMGISFLRDIGRLNRSILNFSSLIDEFLFKQCFNLLAKETEQLIPTLSQDEGDVGTANVLEIPKGAKMPQYISPPVDPAQFLQSERTSCREAMYSLAAQDMMRELFNGQGASGFSQAQSFSRTIPFISSRAETLQKAEMALMSLTMKLMKKAWDGEIKYKDRYEITNVSDAISQLTLLFRDLGMPSETFAREELKRLVHEYDGKIDDATMKQIESEISKMDFKEWSTGVMKTSKQASSGQGDVKGLQTMQEVMKESMKTHKDGPMMASGTQK